MTLKIIETVVEDFRWVTYFHDRLRKPVALPDPKNPGQTNPSEVPAGQPLPSGIEVLQEQLGVRWLAPTCLVPWGFTYPEKPDQVLPNPREIANINSAVYGAYGSNLIIRLPTNFTHLSIEYVYYSEATFEERGLIFEPFDENEIPIHVDDVYNERLMIFRHTARTYVNQENAALFGTQTFGSPDRVHGLGGVRILAVTGLVYVTRLEVANIREAP